MIMRKLVATSLLISIPLGVFAQRTFDTDILAETFGFDESTPKAVDLSDLHQGCPRRDCIQSIDDPVYVAADEAGHVGDDDIVITLKWEGEYRAYPARILDHHEIVNDTIADTPLAITWCPLCGSAVGIRRTIGDTITEFGVSGVLYNSDLVLYDRETETLWDQIGGTGIVGSLTGTKLDFVGVSMTTWGRWRESYPETLVLAQPDWYDGDYSADRYADYRASANLMFPVLQEDERVHPKTVVYGFNIDGEAVAFAEGLLRNGDVEHGVGGHDLTVSMGADGDVRAVSDSGEEYVPIRLFWFAWYTFHPQTGLVN